MRNELSSLSAREAAARLIGCKLVRELDGKLLSGIIVETEAYDQTDIASHSYRGMTARNSAMFERGGLAYVYFTYGMHYCMNVVVGKKGYGSGVLIRAVEPLEGVEQMMEYRKTNHLLSLCNGPAKLAQALRIDREFNGHDLSKRPLSLELNEPLPEKALRWTARIGIKEEPGTELKWRAVLESSKFLSRPL